MSNLAIRLLTVFTVGPLLLVLLFFGPTWGFSTLIVLSAGQSAWELLGMTHPAERTSRLLGALTTTLLAAALVFGGNDPRILLTAMIGAIVVSMIVPLVFLGDLSSAALRTLGGMAAPFYAGGLLSMLARLNAEQGALGPRFVFFTLTLAWMGDTGGYTFGRLFGKTKLYEAVSPKKTREGLLGSIVFSSGAGALASLTYLPVIPLGAALGLGVLAALLGQTGDLTESLLKRSTGIKDSGSILPGHGGLLDRIDALLVVAPLVYVYTLWVS